MRRRRVLLACGPALLGVYAWRIEPHWLELVRRPLPVAGLPRDLDGRVLAQVSDVHVGARVDGEYLARSLDRLAALRPDFVVLTGDFVQYDAAAGLDELRSLLQRLPLGRLGTAAVLGNHDYGRNWAERDVGDAVARTVSAAGATVLRNEARTFAGLQIIGVDDYWGPRFEPAGAFGHAEAAAASIALCHNPDAVDDASMRAHRGWILSGHTHGGQCKPPFLPPPLLPVRNRRYTAGAFDLGGGRRLYINRGLGYLRRVRVNVRPEITLFELRRA